MADKVIAITGASSGIGEATARLLARSGAKLVLGARRMERLNALVADIEAQGGAAIALRLDVTDRAETQAYIGAAVERFGRIDVLVNNAGIMKLAPLAEAKQDDWDRMIDVNLRGALNGIAAALPHMMKQQSGHIIMVGSTSGHRVAPMNGVYAATKFAIRALAESIRIEGGSSVRSTLISPGATHTELVENIDHPMIREALASRMADALPVDSIARAIAYAIEQPHEVDVSEVLVRPLKLKD
ncbi:SDR family oxidoreductase [Novosphingobium sp. 9U]|nr:SDR family oxidoreductase [Novosphingobium sp. 9U]VWX54472.1 SDR family oxidoreductase [Novosphingobium sp. 9U]